MQNFRLLSGELIQFEDENFPTRKQINASIKRGVKWITARLGEGWQENINVEILDQQSYHNDVIGQVASLLQPDVENAGYFTVLNAGILYNTGTTNVYTLGFAIKGGRMESSYAVLTDAWKRYFIKWRKDNERDTRRKERALESTSRCKISTQASHASR